MLNIQNVSIPLNSFGKAGEILIETGKFAKQANGSVTVRLGDTMILATAVYSKGLRDGVDFLPLTVDYREKYYAGGRIPGGFLKREGRPSDEEILTMRLIDRVLRPLFPSDFHLEVQVMIQLLSYGGDFRPAALAGLAASAAVCLAGLPVSPISEVQVARCDGQWTIYPTPEQLEVSDMDMIVGASRDSIVMVEGEMKELSEGEMLEAIKFAHTAIQAQVDAQTDLVKRLSIQTIDYSKPKSHEGLSKEVDEMIYDEVYDISLNTTSKKDREAGYKRVSDEMVAQFSDETSPLFSKYPLVDADALRKCFKEVSKKALRNMIFNEGRRLDGRGASDVRPIWSEVDLLPSVHGSAVFTRGETQALVGVAFGTASDANRIDDVSIVTDQKFYLHYNFPPFSTGECRPIRGVSRREVGHGNLAFRALNGVFPYETPYTVRVVSEILESNGSSSMATVCAGSLALMDAGIKMKSPVSGIAMGLVTDGDRFVVLSDILGDEDYLGDMDFKVAGTSEGITACQMDIKISGISYDVLLSALQQAKGGRAEIMEEMNKTMSVPRDKVKSFAPKVECVKIAAKFIGGIIGPGGKVIQELQKKTDTQISIKEDGDFGMVNILGVSEEGIQQAVAEVRKIAFTPETGTVYDATVTGVKPFGVFVKIQDTSVEGLVHVSELSDERVSDVESMYTMGQKVRVKMVGIDKKTAKIRLSIKQA